MLRRSLLGILGLVPLAPIVARLEPVQTLDVSRLTGTLTRRGIHADRIVAGSITAEEIPCGTITIEKLHPMLWSTPVIPEQISAQDRLVGALSLGC